MSMILAAGKSCTADESDMAMVKYTVSIGIMLIAIVATILSIGIWINTEGSTFDGALS